MVCHDKRPLGMSNGVLLLGCLCLFLPSAFAMDRARKESNVDQAVAEFKVTGRGILVALLDRGIDWRNDDFRNVDGSTRIEFIFDLTDDRGATAPGNSYEMGTIFTRREVDDALVMGTSLPTRDAHGHGTTTAGIACGSGRNSPERKYRGVAPDATIVVVKICSDGIPAHDGEPEERFFYRPERVLVAIDFVRDKARELRMPCVMVLNIGSQGGPTDGTSDLCRKIDETVGPGKTGIVFVTGPGDEGINRKHDRMTVVDGMPVSVGTIWDGASARFNICPGDYVVRTEWTDINGVRRTHAIEGQVGEIWKGSSVGPTADGRVGIDFCAPGDSVFTTYNPRSYWSTFSQNLVDDGQRLYGRASAVSAANPLAAGVIALMLELDPTLDAPTVKKILRESARADRFTGKTPNTTWGFGKLDALAALKRVKADRENKPQSN
jgi:subtilisin family serine protease